VAVLENIRSLQENISLITNFSNKITTMTNFDTNSQSKKLLVNKIVIIINKKIIIDH